MAEKCIHRVIVAPGRWTGTRCLHMVRELSDMTRAPVSVLPATPPVCGSSVELDDIHGLTLLGVADLRDEPRRRGSSSAAFDVSRLEHRSDASCHRCLSAIALAIKFDSRGPVLFRQRRIGRDGHAFEMLKFRSMFDGSHDLRESCAS